MSEGRMAFEDEPELAGQTGRPLEDRKEKEGKSCRRAVARKG